MYLCINRFKTSEFSKTVKLLEENGALNYTVVISADSGEAVLNQYLAPYVGCTIVSILCTKVKMFLIVYDDLSNHAIAFREMSLLCVAHLAARLTLATCFICTPD